MDRDRSLLTEGPAIVQYMADQKPDSGLAPKSGTKERLQLQEWLNFISTELHKGFAPLFNAKVPEEYKAMARERLAQRISFVAQRLEGNQHLLGERFTLLKK